MRWCAITYRDGQPMKIRLLIAFSWLLFIAQGRPEGIYDFSGGMNTSSSWPFVAGNQGYRCQNFVLDDPVGTLRPRHGFHAVTDSLADYTRIRSLNTYRFQTWDGFLFQVVQRDTVTKECDLYVSDANKYNLNTKLASHLYPNTGQWVNWLGAQYYFNGRQPAIVVTGGPHSFEAAEMIPPGPGQLLAIPLAEAGPLDGEYIYGVVGQIPCSTVVPTWSKRSATLSRAIPVDSGKVRLTNFYAMGADSACAAPDSLWYLLVRTRGNHNDWNEDSLFIVDSLHRANSSTDTIVWIDSLSDTLLDSTRFWNWLRDRLDLAGGDTADFAWNRGQLNKGYALGSMTMISLVSADSGEATILPGTTPGGCHQANLYAYTLLDRETNVQSDTSRLLRIGRAYGQGDSSMTFGVPLPPSGRYYRVVYRAHMLLGEIPLSPADYNPNPWSGYLCPPFYAVDTIYDSTATTWFDNHDPAKVETDNEMYDRQLPANILSGAIIHEAKMYGWDRQRIYASLPDTARFPALTNVAFDLDDGERIYGAMSFEGYIIVYKANSRWVLFTTDGEIYKRSKASKGIGMIAPHSLSQYQGANIYLGPQGVSYEVDSRYRAEKAERQDKYLSDPIRNLLVRDQASMVDAVGIVVGERWLLSLSGTDTTFVYFFRTGGWGIFDFDFADAVLYDTVGTEHAGFEHLWFMKDSDERLYVWDEADSTDNGSPFLAAWEKRWLFRESWGYSTFHSAILQQRSTMQATETVLLTMRDEDSVLVGVLAFDSLASHQYRHGRYATSPANRGFHHLNIGLLVANRPELQIQGLDLDVRPGGLTRPGP